MLKKRGNLRGSVTATACLYPAVRHGDTTEKGKCKRVDVMLDTGATRTVIPATLVPLPEFDRGPKEPAWLADDTKVEMPTTQVFLQLPGCRTVRLAALVSERRSKERGIIVGHDYLESADVTLEPRKRRFRCRRSR